MKSVVINALQYKQNSSGIGVMIRELFSRYTAITTRQCRVVLPSDGPEFPAGKKTDQVRIPWTHGQSIRRILFQTFSLGRKYGRNAILLTTDSKVPFFLPKNCTLVPLITDLAVFRMPHVYQMSRVLWWRFQYQYLRRRANLFLTISDFTKSEIVELLKIAPEKIHVVHCAASEQMKPVTDKEVLRSLTDRYCLPERFVLFVGNNNPRKNLERMISAFEKAKGISDIPHHLVIAGEQGWKFNRSEMIRSLRHEENIHFIGFVPDEDMPVLYSAADLFVFPTLYEGFGIPVVEAQLCGTPVLVSNLSSMPEVSGKCAIFVNPFDVDEICSGMLRILQNPILAQELVQGGFENAQRFSWKLSAQRLSQIIDGEISE